MGLSSYGDLRVQGPALMGAKDATRPAEVVINTPAPEETLIMFYASSHMSSLDTLISAPRHRHNDHVVESSWLG